MEKLYDCDNVIFRTRQDAEDYAKYVYEKVDAFAKIREWYIDKDDWEKWAITPLEKKKHKMNQRLDKMKEDFE